MPSHHLSPYLGFRGRSGLRDSIDAEDGLPSDRRLLTGKAGVTGTAGDDFALPFVERPTVPIALARLTKAPRSARSKSDR